MRYVKLPWMILAGAMALAGGGCRDGGPTSTAHLVSLGGEKLRVAVIPFEAASPQQEGATQAVTQELVTALIATGIFDVVEPGAVYAALGETGTRNPYGLDPTAMQKLQESIGAVQLFVMGTVQEFGEVRVGPATHPSISLSARAVEAQTGKILWAGSVSRTGADTEKIFGLGAVHSSGRLTRAAIRELLRKVDRRALAQVVRMASAEGQKTPATVAAAPTARPAAPAAAAARTVASAGRERFMDESVGHSEASMQALMVDVEGLAKGPVGFREHHFAIAETTYQGQGFRIEAKLVDYRKVQTALAFVKRENPEGTVTLHAGVPSYWRASPEPMGGGHHLDLAVGRFGLFLTGPSSHREEMEKVAGTLVAAMR